MFWRLSLVTGLFILTSCNESAMKPTSDAGATVAGLTPAQASQVLAKVGDRTITLGDFAQTLERMDQFDRLRYQTKERRRELLNEMIDIELLAAEAKKQGLDKSPEAQDQIRQILRAAVLSQVQRTLPAPAEISADEVKKYYETHADQYREPERRRISAIVLNDKKEAEKILKLAIAAKTATEWGELFFKHSITAPKTKNPHEPVELAGDLGIVGPPEDTKGANTRVPESIRKIAFELPEVGRVSKDLVEVDGKYFIVRLSGITQSHTRSLAEADRSIRVAILQKMLEDKENALDAELRQRFPVVVDEKALQQVNLPGEKSANPPTP